MSAKGHLETYNVKYEFCTIYYVEFYKTDSDP